MKISPKLKLPRFVKSLLGEFTKEGHQKLSDFAKNAFSAQIPQNFQFGVDAEANFSKRSLFEAFITTLIFQFYYWHALNLTARGNFRLGYFWSIFTFLGLFHQTSSVLSCALCYPKICKISRSLLHTHNFIMIQKQILSRNLSQK